MVPKTEKRRRRIVYPGIHREVSVDGPVNTVMEPVGVVTVEVRVSKIILVMVDLPLTSPAPGVMVRGYVATVGERESGNVAGMVFVVWGFQDKGRM